MKFVALSTYLFFTLGCATSEGIALTSCLSDPPSKAMICKDSATGLESQIPWEASGEMVCLPRGDYRYLLNAAGVGK